MLKNKGWYLKKYSISLPFLELIEKELDTFIKFFFIFFALDSKKLIFIFYTVYKQILALLAMLRRGLPASFLGDLPSPITLVQGLLPLNPWS